MATPIAMEAEQYLVHVVFSFKSEPHKQWQVAEDLRRLGVAPGNRMGRIGGQFCVGWARLLRVTVVAEVSRTDVKQFWNATPQVQAQVIDAFRRLGVTALVAEQIPQDGIYSPPPGWVKLGDSEFYALIISPIKAK